MIHLAIQKQPINPEALDEALRATLGEIVYGLSTNDQEVIVHLADNASPAQQTQARNIVQTHDPAVLTAAQQAEQDRAQKLTQARQAYGAAELDLSAYGGQPALIQQLAQKIVLLERETAALRR